MSEPFIPYSMQPLGLTCVALNFAYHDLHPLARHSSRSSHRTSPSEKKFLTCVSYRLVCGFDEIFAHLRNVGDIGAFQS